jgi:hypothetical protein
MTLMANRPQIQLDNAEEIQLMKRPDGVHSHTDGCRDTGSDRGNVSPDLLWLIPLPGRSKRGRRFTGVSL